MHNAQGSQYTGFVLSQVATSSDKLQQNDMNELLPHTGCMSTRGWPLNEDTIWASPARAVVKNILLTLVL